MVRRSIASRFRIAVLPWTTACWDATSDACLQVADYCGWAVQRKWESSAPLPYQRIADKVRSEYDLFARGKTLYY